MKTEKLIEEVKAHLKCNATKEIRGEVYFDFTEKEIDDNIEYFQEATDYGTDCGVSLEKTMMCFNDYIKQKREMMDFAEYCAATHDCKEDIWVHRMTGTLIKTPELYLYWRNERSKSSF
jgi:hypothetical protein